MKPASIYPPPHACYSKHASRSPRRGKVSPLSELAAHGNMRGMQGRSTLTAYCDSTLSAPWAACAVEIKSLASREIKMLPAGEFIPVDGRRLPVKAWRTSAEIAAKIIARADALKRKLVIDYEHQTLHAETNGQPAPAAARFKKLEWREGDGLYAVDVEWTARAKQMIEAGEYLYISPVFDFDIKTGDVIALRHAALVNDPALDSLGDVLARAAARFNAQPSTETTQMPLLKSLIAALGLAETATEADVQSGVAALKAKADQSTALETEVAALKSQKPDPAKFVPVEAMQALQTDVAALRAQAQERDVNEVIAAALVDGKLLPPQEAWARELGKKDLAALKSYMATATPIAALRGTQTGGKGPAGGGSGDSNPNVVAAAALKYQREQAAAGTTVSTVEAVNFVILQGAK